MFLSNIGFYFHSPEKSGELDFLTFSYSDEFQDDEAYFNQKSLGETFSFIDPTPLYRVKSKQETDLYDFSKLFPSSFQYKELDESLLNHSAVYLSSSTYQKLLDNAPFYNRWTIKAREDNIDEINKAKEDALFAVNGKNYPSSFSFPANTATSLFIFLGEAYILSPLLLR